MARRGSAATAGCNRVGCCHAPIFDSQGMQIMTDTISILDAQTYVRDRLSTAALDPVSLEARAYPEETILILRVHPSDKSRAAELANELDNELAQRGFDGFITVRAAEVDTTTPKGALKRG